MLNAKEEAFIKEHINDDIRHLALSMKQHDNIRKEFVLQQIAGRQVIKHKVPSWINIEGLIFPQQLSLEQCSSEATALYKARLAGSGHTMIDMTGGFGVDFIFMSAGYDNGIYIEQSATLCDIAKHNFKLLRDKTSSVICNDGVKYIQQMTDTVDLVYLDPARRDINGGKVVRISDCTPNLSSIEKSLVAKSKRVIAKLSPMLDINDTLSRLSYIKEVHIVSSDNECKELLLVMDSQSNNNVTIHTANIFAGGIQSFTYALEDNAVDDVSFTTDTCQYLYEPNSSIMKAGGFKIIASRFNVKKLHPNSHLYTDDTLIGSFPGRRFTIIKTLGFSKSELSSLQKEFPRANIAVRNFPLRAEELRKKLKIKDGGDIYIFASTLYNDKHVLIVCKKA